MRHDRRPLLRHGRRRSCSGRAGLGPEPNQPNTIADSCADGTSGTFHSDESNDRIKVSTTDGSNFAPGKTVTHRRHGLGLDDAVGGHRRLLLRGERRQPDLDAHRARCTPTAAGAQTLSATYTLPGGRAAGGARAVPLPEHERRLRGRRLQRPRRPGLRRDQHARHHRVLRQLRDGAGWTTNPNGTDTATTGAWERGDPEDTTDTGAKQLGTTVSGVNDLVDRPSRPAPRAGANDVDGGTTTHPVAGASRCRRRAR